MKYEVYHANNPTFGMVGPQPKFPEDFKLVAKVDCDGFGSVFELTNTIDHYWGENKEVETIDGPHRSTSVGDVVVSTETKKAYLCAFVGWEEIKE